MKLKDNGRINFIINVHDDITDMLTGGVIAFHYLAYLLAKEEHNVYMFARPEYPHKNIYTLTSQNNNVDKDRNTPDAWQWEAFEYYHQNTVAIYDQTKHKNWFGTEKVVRWFLYNQNDDSIEKTWGENDYYFCYGKQKSVVNLNKKQNWGELIAMNFYFEVFKNNNNKHRKGFCHLNNKHSSPKSDIFTKELNSTSLDNWKSLGCQKYLNEEFNKHEYFLCYDQLSFWPQIAALCGCKVIIMNVKDNLNAYYDYNTTPQEYRLDNPLKKYGIAFGFDDLQHAINTQHLVKDHLIEMDNYNKNTVKNFVKFWENKCYA